MPGCFSKSIPQNCCDVGHTWRHDCLLACFDLLVDSFKYSLKLYTPLYVASALLTGKRKEYFIKKLYAEVLQSCTFLSGNTCFMMLFFCFFRKCLGCFYPLTVGVIPGILSSFCAILIERKSRRPALAVYMLNQAFDTSFNMLKFAGIAKDIPYGEVAIFSLSMAMLLYLYRTDSLPDGFVKSLFNFFLKKKNKELSNARGSSSCSDKDHDKSNPTKLKYVQLDRNESFLMSCKAFGLGYGIQTLYYFLGALPNIMSKPENLLKAFLKQNSFRLAAFLGSLVGLYQYTEELLSKVSTSSVNHFIAGGVAGCSMLFQRSSYIALYVASKTCELVYMSGIEKGYLPYIKHFDTILYTACTALMFNAALLQPLYLRSTYWKFLDGLTNKRFRIVKREYFNPFGYDSNLMDRLEITDPVDCAKFKFHSPN